MRTPQARRMRLLTLIAALAALAVAAVPDVEAKRAAGGRVTYIVKHDEPELVISGTVVARATRSAKKRPRLRVVLQQLSTSDGFAWHDRVQRTVRQGDRKTRFLMRWRPSAQPPEIVTLRVVVFSGRRQLAKSATKFVPVEDPGTVFYSGACNAGAAEASGARLRLTAGGRFCLNTYDGLWTGPTGGCDTSRGAAFPPVVRGEPITHLAGYSLGRLGPMYFLKERPHWASQINYILLLDPGNAKDFEESCDSSPAIAPWELLRDWLASRATNRLVIFAGLRTAEVKTYSQAADPQTHTGLQAYYLRSLSAETVANQVLICDVNLPHDTKRFMGALGPIVGGPPPNACPEGMARWHPKKPSAEAPGGTGPAPGAPAEPGPGGGSQPPTPAPATRVNPYDNYGPANAGRPMCRGNPARPESMPGGTVAQSFTVPPGVASIDTAMVQIDPDARVTAHATLYVGGTARATANAAAGGDTSFTFPSVGVAPGDQVTISIAFSATFGKIITVYTAGNPGGSLTASNSCPDGAPSFTTTTTGLRAVISGWSR